METDAGVYHNVRSLICTMERRISHRLSDVPSSVISESTTQDSRADTPGGDPPGIDPPVVGKVTHYSIELFWDVKNILMNDDTPEESIIFSIEEEDSHTHTYGTVFTGVTKHHVAEGLEPNTPYKFRLKVSYANGEYAYSSVVSISTTRGHFIADHLQRAVNLNDSKAVRRILQEGAVYVDVLDNLGFTPLMTASQEGFTKIVALLVEHGADVRKVNGSGKDSVMLACHSGHLDVVQYLLSKGASWKKRDKAGCIALHYAVDGGHLNVIDWLLKSGCRVDERDGVLEWTSLMRVSAITGNAEVASFLIKSGADVNARDVDGKTPLMVATLNNHERLAKVLLEKGADPLLANEYGRTIIDMAKALHKPHMVTLLETFAKT